MNLIADRLFALLLGWTNALFNSLWNLLTNNTSGVSGFFQTFWLPIILLLLAFGTVVDYLVWLVRWRPYYVWSTWLQKRTSERRRKHSLHYMEDLDHSPLDLPEYHQVHEEFAQTGVMDEPIYFDFNLPYQTEQEEAVYYPPELPLTEAYQEEVPQSFFTPNLPWEDTRQQFLATQAPLPDQPWLTEPTAYEEENFLPVDEQSEQKAWLSQYDQPEALPERGELEQSPRLLGASRRRRVDSRRQRGAKMFQTIKDTFFVPEDELLPTDSIQAPVSQEDAFHKPFYPQNYTYKSQQDNNQNNDRQTPQ